VKKLRDWLVMALLTAFTVRVVWWAIEPLLPYVVSALVLVLVLGFIYFRMFRW